MGRRKQKDKKGHGKEKNFNRSGGKLGEGYDLTMRDNQLFVKYYQGQGMVPEGEWEEFYETLKKTLPVTFRITGYRSQSEELLKNIKGNFFSSMLNVKVDGEEVPEPKCIPWYPDQLAWQLDLTRKIIRSSEHFSRLHDFLVAETECGAISRQEAVSMIPPLVLDIKSHHAILDMCASPGSKTAQLIEYLHSSSPTGDLPTGYVVANDTDNKRCYLMVHQVKRLQSPCCMIVNHDGTTFPKIKTNDDDCKSEFQMFDRVLCDVPCSGDGTMRKNFDIWSKWHPLQGASMHGLQSKILKRGCQLLAKGGRLVYSTCSLNPAEDEAIIAEMLRSSNGAMELVDVADMLPGLKFTKGLSTWKVMTKTGEWIPNPSEIPPALQTQFKHTIFPPSSEEAEKFNLNRCIRVLPHQQDSGGFFVAALQKVHHLPGSRDARLDEEDAAAATGVNSTEEGKEPSAPVPVEQKGVADTSDKRKAPESGEEPRPKKRKIFGYREDPFLFMEENDPIWPQVRDFFGFNDSFPVNQIMFRSQQGKRTLYYVSKTIRDIVKYNEDRIRFVNMGVKAFSRSPSPLVPKCDFRITQECLGTLLPNLTRRVVRVNKEDAIIVISEENPYISKLSDGTLEQLNALPAGSSVFVFTPSEKDSRPNCEVVFCGWRGKTSVRCFGSRCDRSHMLMLLGEDLKTINKRVEEEKKTKQLAKEKEQSGGGVKKDEEGPEDVHDVQEEMKDTEPGEKDDAGSNVKEEKDDAGTNVKEEKDDARTNVKEEKDNSGTNVKEEEDDARTNVKEEKDNSGTNVKEEEDDAGTNVKEEEDDARTDVKEETCDDSKLSANSDKVS